MTSQLFAVLSFFHTKCSNYMDFQDVLNKIMSFSQNGPRAVCIMSGIGVITNVTLRQAATSGGTATYEVCLVFIFYDQIGIS